MEFFFPDDLTPRLPPDEVKVAELTAEPYEDGKRLRVNMKITPFEKRPHIDVSLRDAEGNEISATSFVEPMHWNLEFTMHLRVEPAPGEVTLEARLFYPDGPQAEPARISLQIPPASG